MRKNWILLIFSIVTSIIVWDSLDFYLDDLDKIEEAYEEGIEYESSEGEEESEIEHFNSVELFANQGIPNISILAYATSFYYSFSINTICLEPEVNPPRC